MHIERYEVTVHHLTTRRFLVPKYDIPILEAIWKPALAKLNDPERRFMKVEKTGIIDARNFHDEKLRIRTRDYNTAIDGKTIPPHEIIYPSDQALENAYNEAVKECEALMAEVAARERRPAVVTANPAAIAPDPKVAELAAKAEAQAREIAELKAQLEAAKPRIGRPPKPQPVG